ncbi:MULTISPECIES: GAF domain-containing protein [Salinibaculum]|uniref:GAF domain-containing protein n=1 Tax=Salinibaculum TaxID=2732368 RepID=UPI0030CD84D8
MHTTTTTLDVLYVAADDTNGAAIVDQLRFDEDALRLTVATSIDDAAAELERGTFDSVLCDPGEGNECLALVRELQSEQPGLPVVVFAPDATSRYVSELLRAGAADVIQSGPASTPPSLVVTRLQSVVGTPVAGSIHRERLERYETLLNTAGDAIYQLDAKGTIVAVNDATVSLTGYERSELIGEHVSKVMRQDHIEDGEQLIRSQLRADDHRVDTLEMDLLTRDGRAVPCETRIAVVTVGGKLTGSVGVIRDVTEQRERERQLQAERDLVEGILDTSPVGICVYGPEGSLVRANDRAREVLGLSAEELAERTFDDQQWEVYDADGESLSSAEFPVAESFETGEPAYGYEAVVRQPGGDERRVSLNSAPMVDDDGDVTRVVVTVQDVTDRRARERKIAEQRDALERLDRINDVIRAIDQALVRATTRADVEQAVCDRLTGAGRYGFALALRLRGDDTFIPHAWTAAGEEFVEEVFPTDASNPETSPGRRALEREEVEVVHSMPDEAAAPYWHADMRAAGVESVAAIPVTYEGTRYGVIAVYAEEADVFSERELEVLGELGDTVGYAIAAVERREREEMLTRLYETTQDLLGVETEQEVCEVVVDAAADVLGLPGVGIFLFDDEENVLAPAAATETLMEYYGEPIVFGPGHEDSIAWQTYVSGETQTFADVRTDDRASNAETDARSVMLVPLGDHGIFVASSPEPGGLEDRIQRLVGLLAATTEAALDRVAGRAGIRERDRILADRTERLDRTEGMLEFVRDVDQLLVRAGTREEIEQQVCERLTGMEPYTFAWIGTVPPDGDRVEPQTWAGAGDGYLDAVSLAVDGAEPAARTAESGSATVVSNVADDIRGAAWARAALDRNFQSAAAVPLVHGETTYGVLAVYGTEPDAFAEPVAGVLGDLGELIAYGINTTETRRGILAEQVTELELRIGGAGTFLNAVAGIADQPVTYREILPERGGRAQVLFALADAPVEAVLALEEEFVSVESLTHVAAGEEHLFRATVGGETVAATLLRCGSIPREVVATADETRAVVRLPQELDVRVFLDRVRTSYQDTELLSRQDVERQPRIRSDVREALEAKLTDRQREVLVTAYECGFFESPRETTGAELATLLGISQPTLTHHLREAQRRLFETLYEETD